MVDQKTSFSSKKKMKQENKHEVKICIYCNQEIKDWEAREEVVTKRSKIKRCFHKECYLRTTRKEGAKNPK